MTVVTETNDGVLRIAIVGTAPSSRHLAPYGDPAWTIWASSPSAQHHIERFDAWFELHDWEHLAANVFPKHPGYQEFLAGIEGKPVYMLEARPEIPASVRFPGEVYKALYPNIFLSSTPALEAAHAIAAGPAEIGLWGIDMAVHEEWHEQRPGMEFFKDKIRALGIKLTIPPESDLNSEFPVYALDPPSPMRAKLLARQQELTAWRDRVRENKNNLMLEEAFLDGALDDLSYMLRMWAP